LCTCSTLASGTVAISSPVAGSAPSRRRLRRPRTGRRSACGWEGGGAHVRSFEFIGHPLRREAGQEVGRRRSART
jgi:hypothetical protein